MSRELAAAYVNIVPATGQIAPGVRKALGAVEADGARTSARLGADLKGAFTTAAAGATTLVAGLIAGLAGLAAKGGFSRALAIDAAQAKMVALRYSQEQITSVMETALQAVRGTAFGLGDAASLATQLLASGIAPGEALARALGNTADLAAVAGVGLGDLQSVMGQLAGKGRLYTEDLMQLGERGLPVFAWLADSAGVTQEEIRKMVSEGKLDFADLQAAIEKNIGGAAKATDSFASSWSNIKAALSRSGAVAATPIIDALKSIFDAGIPLIDALTSRLTPIVEAVVDKLTPGFQVFLDALSGNSEFGEFDGLLGTLNDIGLAIGGFINGDGLGPLTEQFSGLFSILAPFVGLIASAGTSTIASLLGPLGALIPTVSPLMSGLLGLLVALFSQSEALREVSGTIFRQLQDTLLVLKPSLEPILSLFASIAGILGDVLAQLLSVVVLPLLATLANEVLPALVPVLTTLVSSLLPVLTTVLDAVAPVLGVLVDSLLPAFRSVLNAVMPILTNIGNIVSGVLSAAFARLAPLLEELAPIFGEVITLVGSVLSDALNTVAPLLSLVGDIIMQLLPVVFSLIEPLLAVVVAFLPLLGVLGDLISTLLPVVVELLMAVLPPLADLIASVVEYLVPALEWLAQVIERYVVPYIETMVSFWGKVITVVIDVAKVIIEKLIAAMQWYVDKIQTVGPAIKQFVEDGINRIKDFAEAWRERIEAVVGFVLGIRQRILDAFTGAKDWLVNVGKTIIQGLIDGFLAAFDKVKETLTSLTDKLPEWKGPEAKDRTLLVRPAEVIMDGFTGALEGRYASIRASLQGFTAELAPAAVAAPVEASSEAITRADLEAFAAEIANRIAALAALIADRRIDALADDVRDLSRQGGEVAV